MVGRSPLLSRAYRAFRIQQLSGTITKIRHLSPPPRLKAPGAGNCFLPRTVAPQADWASYWLLQTGETMRVISSTYWRATIDQE